MDLLHLTCIAIKAARAAGAVIEKYMHEDVAVQEKLGGSSRASQVLTKVDLECEAVILTHLRPTVSEFDLAYLTEETEDDGSRFEKDFFWCVDPMDGTLAFINKTPGFSVSIALVAKDGSPQIGVVYDPSTNTMYHAAKGHGAFKDGLPWTAENANDFLSYVTDKMLKDTPRRVEIEELLRERADKLGLKEVKEISGAGAVLCAIRVVENGPACMLKFPKEELGGGSLWDYAATACIFQELGLSATNFAVGKLDLNKQGDTFMNGEGVFYANLSRNIT